MNRGLPDLFDPRRAQQLKGDNDRYVQKKDVARILADLLRSGTYQTWNGDSNESLEITSFRENSEYWEQARTKSFFHGQRIRLADFWLTEWTPFSPGQYFTEEAKQNREEASSFYDNERSEYLPLGKKYMMLGGIGSLRFSPKEAGDKNIFVLGASSSGVSHEGIPLTCEEDIYLYLAQKNMKQAGGVRCDIHGYIRHLPNKISGLVFSRDVEKYCIHTTDVKVKRAAGKEDLLCTAQILFPSHYSTYKRDDSDEYFFGDGYKTRLVKSWSFASFRPGHDTYPGTISLTDAVKWLQVYAGRYGDEGAPLLNDFDEIQNHFYNPIEFRLSAIKEGDIDIARLESYQRYAGGAVFYVQNMELRMGHTFQNISGSTIISDSIVINSLNTIKDADPELAAAFEQIAKAVEASNDAAAIATYKELVRESAQSKPDKGKLRQLWDGLVSLAPGVGAVASAVSKITSLFI
jgi:hypothetical protein